MEGFILLLNFLQDLQSYVCYSKILPVAVSIFVTVLFIHDRPVDQVCVDAQFSMTVRVQCARFCRM